MVDDIDKTKIAISPVQGIGDGLRVGAITQPTDIDDRHLRRNWHAGADRPKGGFNCHL